MSKKATQTQPQPAPDHRGQGGSYVTNPETSEVTLVERGGQEPAVPKRRGFGEADAAPEQPKE